MVELLSFAISVAALVVTLFILGACVWSVVETGFAKFRRFRRWRRRRVFAKAQALVSCQDGRSRPWSNRDRLYKTAARVRGRYRRLDQPPPS